ncbi:MAG: class I SAM-dependent methyltransferase [Spirochaetes bacterium]|nr:class I SAM-dependent methyltransferase [Spirochaetota bacterium]
MKMNESFAGVATSSARVIESYYPHKQRLFDDPYAYSLLPTGWKILVRILYLPLFRKAVLAMREKRTPGGLGALLCRVRYIDDLLLVKLKEGLDQVVILGAGFDSRAYRIPGIDQLTVFEVDLPGLCKLKKKQLKKVLNTVPKHVQLVEINFDKEDLAEVMKKAGFQRDKKNFFIWEGVTQYIAAEAVDQTLSFVTSDSKKGSFIAFTYARQSLIDRTDCPEAYQKLLKFAEKVGSPFQFGIDPAQIEIFLSKRDLKLLSDIGAADYPALFLNKLGRNLPVFDGERVVFAEVK